jgi:hypothetical protein
MGRPNFNPALELPPIGGKHPPDKVPGPTARGPVGDDKKLLWIYVWLIQNGENEDKTTWAAAADGEVDDVDPISGEWTVETDLTHFKDPETGETRPSDNFRAGTPALATAMALSRYNKDNREEIEWWSEPIMIVGPPRSGALPRP